MATRSDSDDFGKAERPKLRILFSLKLNNWYKVGETLGFSVRTLERVNEVYKGNKSECKRKMFGLWLQYSRNPTYKFLMQALVNAGEEIAAEDLSKKSSAAISKPVVGNLAEPYKQLGHFSLVYSGPSKEAKKQMKLITTEYLDERESKMMQEFKRRLSRVRNLALLNQWQRLYSVNGDFPPNITLWPNIDMGEIAEVQEICPILLSSNMFHFVCLDCHEDRSAQITSVKSDTQHQTSHESSESRKDFLHQTLHAIHSIWRSLKNKFSPKRFAAVLVGNNKERCQERVVSVDKEIQCCLKECGCCQGREIKYSYYRENKMIHTLDKNDDTYVKTVLKHIEKNQTNFIRVPQSLYNLLCVWFFGGFQVIEYTKFEELAVICGINRESVESSLEYIHSNTGLILHYADVPFLCNLVISPQILVDALSNLLLTALRYNPKLRFTGVIKKRFLEDISSSKQSISSIGLIDLLKHYNFLADLQDSSYFIPFLLQRYHLARKSHLSDNIQQSLFPSSMIINFDSEDVPVGIFYGLVTQLSKSWQLSSEVQYKNRITFQFDDEIQCMVVSYPSCLEIGVIGSTKSYPIKLYDICLEITEILQLLLSFYKHTEDINFTIQLPCPGSFKKGGTFHFASIISSPSTQCKCNGPTPCAPDGVIPLTDHESIAVWFAKEQDPLELSSSNFIAKSQYFPDDDKVFNILQSHIFQEGGIRLRAAKSLLYGPPKVGKTSLRMRLTGEIENLSQAIPPTSTGY